MAQSGPQNGAPWAALSCFQLLSLSTEKGQVPFGASVGVVSFFTTLGAAGREEDKKQKQKDNTFQMQFSTKAAPTKYQVGNRDSEILSGSFIRIQGKRSYRRYSGTETAVNNSSDGGESPAALRMN